MLSIQYIYFNDHQSFNDFELESNGYFVLVVYLILANEAGSSLFYFDITNDYIPRSDRILINSYEIFFRKKAVFVMESFDKYSLLSFINTLIKEISINKTQDEILSTLSNYFYWKFDNYVPYKD